MSKQTNVQLLKDDEQLVFIHECLPQLAAGKYTVTADLVIEGEKQFDKAKKEFWVDAPRFLLQQSEIYSVYPPKDATGRFEATLPHIVFNRRTLPWERTIDGSAHDPDAPLHAPWMGLLLLNEDEINAEAGKITVEQKTLKDTLKASDAIFAPELSNGLSGWQDENSTCETIEIPTQLFKSIIPQKSDLPFLAHVRKVIVNENKERADIDDGGYFSTLVCNRLPTRDANEKKSKRNTVFLVSLEGFQNYFSNPAHIKQNKVRLVVLTSWSFTVAEGKNFRELCDELHVSPFKMNTPNVKGNLKGAYDFGYTLLPHVTRNGAKTFSWYRGPFNPNFLPTNPETRIFDSADEALRFDEGTGLFDISYAAAWQLGRLLALKDKAFSGALYQWKMQDKRNAVKKAAKKEVAALLPAGYVPVEGKGEASLEETVKKFLEQKYNAGTKEHVPVVQLSSDPGDVRARLAAADGRTEDNPAPKEVTDWLGKLFLLNGVPINYLVPHESYLVNNNNVKEALGTFYIDYDWIEALIGGALSIVALKDHNGLLNMLKDGRFLPKDMVDKSELIDGVPASTIEAVPGHITGFLLRSELVSGWKGIKIFPKDRSGKWMDAPLRIERIAEDIKLCIFSGKVQEIVFIQPPEGIHFGISGVDSIPVTKKMRKEDGTVDDNKTMEVSFLNKDKRVVSMAQTAAAAKLNTSADLAFQMLEVPVMFALKINDK
ncbi:MAG: hypothetical protein JWQ38_2306 [Flavipsychrobacter sp.]|nr:hypothetical protein [Flavipsychrobacter sp.]